MMEPDDIYWAARAAVDGLPEVNRDFVIAAMVRAILAERKRCAEVALREGDKTQPAVGYLISKAIEASQ